MGKKIMNAIYEGELKIGNISIPCAVLENGERVISQRATFSAIGRSEKRSGGKGSIGADRLPPFLTATNLKPFVDKELAVPTDPIVYKPSHGGRTAHGYKAELLAQTCNVFLDARKAKALTKQQEHIADRCEILLRGFAHVGLVALIDEATGYEKVRDKEALQAILEAYLVKQFAAWAKRFPDEFYFQMFRLKGWTWRGMKVNRPSVVGKYTNDIVYERLAPNILKELEKRNPPNEKGQRKAKHHQWLTEDIGHPALAQHLYAVIGIMRIARDWEQFKRMLNRAFPKPGHTLALPFKEE